MANLTVSSVVDDFMQTITADDACNAIGAQKAADAIGLGGTNAWTGANSYAGVSSFTGAIVNVPTSDAGTSIDVTKVLTTKSLTGDVTETFSATPTTGTRIIRQYTADGTDRTVTPDNNSGTVYFSDLGSTASSFVVKASTTRAVVYERQSARWVAYGTGTVNAVFSLGTFAAPVTTDPYTLTAANSWGSALYYGATGTVNLPAGQTGMNIVIVNTGAFTITIDPNGSQAIVREGTTQSGGVSMTLSSGAGNFVVLMFDGTNWATLGYRGTLAQGS